MDSAKYKYMTFFWLIKYYKSTIFRKYRIMSKIHSLIYILSKSILQYPRMKVNLCVKPLSKFCKFFREYGFCNFGEWCKFIHFEKENYMEKYKRENKIIMKKLTNIDKEFKVINQYEEEIVTKRLVDVKISELENIIADKDDIIQ